LGQAIIKKLIAEIANLSHRNTTAGSLSAPNCGFWTKPVLAAQQLSGAEQLMEMYYASPLCYWR
jgi:hypothetical protein